jgi:hypothetical protein
MAPSRAGVNGVQSVQAAGDRIVSSLMYFSLISAIEAAAKGVGWAANLRRDRLKKRIWETLLGAEPRGLDATGIHTKLLGGIIADVPLAAIFGEAKNQRWLEIRNRWRAATKLPTTSQISDALYEMSKDGTVRHLGGGRYGI